MRANLGVAIFVGMAASAVGAGTLDGVQQVYGSESTGALTISVLSQCEPLHAIFDPIAFAGNGASPEDTLFGANPTQMVAPMTRALGEGICAAAQSTRAGAEGMVLALDAVSVVVNRSTVGPEGIDYPGTAGNSQNQWREVLRLVYACVFRSDPISVPTTFDR